MNTIGRIQELENKIANFGAYDTPEKIRELARLKDELYALKMENDPEFRAQEEKRMAEEEADYAYLIEHEEEILGTKEDQERLEREHEVLMESSRLCEAGDIEGATRLMATI